MQVRPTLIIGLGGSGTFVVRRLKKRLRRVTQGELPPSIQLLAFDTDQQKLNDTLDLLNAGEFHRLSNFNGAVHVTSAALSANPAIAAFWAYRDLIPDFVEDGAKQRPPVGRLALFVRFEELQMQIRRAVARIFQPAGAYVPPPNINAVDTYIIGSSCGGTGAGMYFDVAVICKHLIAEGPREANIQGHVFLPSCFSGEQIISLQSIQTNSCAFLRTMELMQSSQAPAIQYPGFKTGAMAAPLFRRVHLISAVDMTGIGSTNLQETFENVALQLDLEITSASARDMRSAADNCPPDFNNRPVGRLAVYSSYGAAMLSGSSTVGRLAVLPIFASRLFRYITSSLSSAPVPATTNRALTQVMNVLTKDNEAFALADNFQMEASRMVNTERPADAARNLVRTIDNATSSLTFSWISELPDLEKELRSEVGKLIEAGEGGIPASVDYLEQALKTIGDTLAEISKIEGSQKESANEIQRQLVARMERFWMRNDARREMLQAEVFPVYRSQTLHRIREMLGGRVKHTLSNLSNEINRWLKNLARFNAVSQSFIEDIEKYSKAAIERQRAIAGPGAGIPEELTEIRRRFDAGSTDLVERFFLDPGAVRALSDLSESMVGNQTIDSWSGSFRRASEDYLKSALAESVTIGSGWAEQAARAIVECQPMVQFVADHLNLGQKAERLAYARAHDAVEVRKRVLEIDPRLNVTIDDTAEPGSLEVTSMVLNFALHQIQEVSLIENGYRNFASSQAEPVENRYAWRTPETVWKRLRQLSVLPLSARDQALARMLSLNPVGNELPVATVSPLGYKVRGEQLDIDPDASQYQKYLALNRKLLASGESERLLQGWRENAFAGARDYLTALQNKTQERLHIAQVRSEEDGGSSFVALLTEECESVKYEISRIPV